MDLTRLSNLKRLRHLGIFVLCLSFFILIASYLKFIWIYSFSPFYLDHVESYITSTSLNFLKGGPVWHDDQSTTQFVLFAYGPITFLVQAAVLSIFRGDVIIISKSVGGAAATLGLLLFAFSASKATQRAQSQNSDFILTLLGTGIYSAVLINLDQFSFWNRGDSLTLLITNLVLFFRFSFFKKNDSKSMIILGLLSALLMNIKIHAILYITPIVFDCLQKSDRKNIFKFIITALIFLSIPFLMPRVSLTSYLFCLGQASKHGFSKTLMLSNLRFFGFVLLGPVFGLYLICGSLHPVKGHTLKSIVPFLVCSLLALLLSSKNGAGRHHLMPFLPVVWIYALKNLGQLKFKDRIFQSKTRCIIFVIGLFTFSTSIFGSIAGVRYQMKHFLHLRNMDPWVNSIRTDLQKISHDFSKLKVEMGIGEGKGYAATYYKPYLLADNTINRYHLDAADIMDFNQSQLALSPYFTEAFFSCELSQIWLVPKGNVPFEMTNFYNNKKLFTEQFKQRFQQRFVKIAETEHFDVYSCTQELKKTGR